MEQQNAYYWHFFVVLPRYVTCESQDFVTEIENVMEYKVHFLTGLNHI